MADLFSSDSDPAPATPASDAPLAERMRPGTLADVIGQEKVLGPGSALALAVRAGELPSLVLWGPPGCGKTTLAGCLAREIEATFLPYSAVRVGVKELKQAMADAGRLRRAGGRAPVLFLDEIHRFNKAQQDALLPSVESGDVILIGATTENPSFEVNAALLSRCRVVVLEGLGEEELIAVMSRALREDEALRESGIEVEPAALQEIARRCGGDARFALNSLDLALRSASAQPGAHVDAALALDVLAQAHLVYDKSGEQHFNVISALHKSLRNSDAQAGLYWLARMVEAGEDPLYIARRLVRFASEDIGLADPSALVQANAALDAVHRIGLPEGALALAQATLYLAQAPKSNALYVAWKEVVARIEAGARDPVPAHLRNAPTSLMRELGYGEGYQYSHDADDAVAEMECLPASMAGSIFYRPSERGFEAEAAQRLREAWRRAHPKPRSTKAGESSLPPSNSGPEDSEES